jgi:Xaa-Pro aminopeptidase
MLMEQHPSGLLLVRGKGAGDDGVNPNFFYLTGIEEPDAALLLAPNGTRIGLGRENPGPDYQRGRMVREILFLPAPDALAAQWGEAGPATAYRVSPERVGVDAVFPTPLLSGVLGRALQPAAKLGYVRGYPAQLERGEDADAAFVARIRRTFFDLDISDATSTVHEMRRIKSSEEVQAIERSIAVVGEALEQVLREVRAGKHEYEIEAKITAIYRAHGGRHAFDPIVGSGANALKLHYTENRGTLGAGELLLVDTGVSIDGYKADITRTIPVNGRFTDEQRAIYETVLAAQQATLQACEPGAMLADLHVTAFEAIDRAGYAAHFPHGTSHHLGLETHDVGDVHRPLAPGAVITVEPGIYIGKSALGVRIEDDVLITDSAHRVLSRAIPKSIEEIEQRMTRT